MKVADFNHVPKLQARLLDSFGNKIPNDYLWTSGGEVSSFAWDLIIDQAIEMYLLGTLKHTRKEGSETECEFSCMYCLVERNKPEESEDAPS